MYARIQRITASLLVCGLLALGVTTAQAQDPTPEPTPEPTPTEERAQQSAQDTTMSEASSELITVLEESGQYATLVDALKKTGLDQALAGSPFTLLAPTDSAFAALGTPVAEMQTEQLAELLRNHVVQQVLTAEQLAQQGKVETARGQTFEVGEYGQSIGSASIVEADLKAGSGVVHGIDAVLEMEDAPTSDAGTSTDETGTGSSQQR